jgi:hypothetical protein
VERTLTNSPWPIKMFLRPWPLEEVLHEAIKVYGGQILAVLKQAGAGRRCRICAESKGSVRRRDPRQMLIQCQ